MKTFEFLHLFFQTIAIVGWCRVAMLTYRKKKYLNYKIAYLIIFVSLFTAFNLFTELHLNGYKKGSSLWMWYPLNYSLITTLYYLIVYIEKLKDGHCNSCRTH